MAISLASCAINAERFDAADFDAGTSRFFATYRGRIWRRFVLVYWSCSVSFGFN